MSLKVAIFWLLQFECNPETDSIAKVVKYDDDENRHYH